MYMYSHIYLCNCFNLHVVPTLHCCFFFFSLKPFSVRTEFIAGETVYSLIGFTNDASIDFVVTAIEASFRYRGSYVRNLGGMTGLL